MDGTANLALQKKRNLDSKNCRDQVSIYEVVQTTRQLSITARNLWKSRLCQSQLQVVQSSCKAVSCFKFQATVNSAENVIDRNERVLNGVLTIFFSFISLCVQISMALRYFFSIVKKGFKILNHR